MKFLDLANSLCTPQVERNYHSYFERKDSIVSDIAARGFSMMQGHDYEKLRQLGQTILQENSEIIWEIVIDSYDASNPKPIAEEIKNYITETIHNNAQSIIATIISDFVQYNVYAKCPNLDVQKDSTRHLIESESRQLIKILHGKLNIFLGKKENLTTEALNNTQKDERKQGDCQQSQKESHKDNKRKKTKLSNNQLSDLELFTSRCLKGADTSEGKLQFNPKNMHCNYKMLHTAIVKRINDYPSYTVRGGKPMLYKTFRRYLIDTWEGVDKKMKPYGFTDSRDYDENYFDLLLDACETNKNWDE